MISALRRSRSIGCKFRARLGYNRVVVGVGGCWGNSPVSEVFAAHTKDLSLDPQHLIKKPGVVMCVLTLSAGWGRWYK